MKDRKIDILLEREWEFAGIKLKMIDLLYVLCLFIFGFIIRWKLMPIQSADYYGFLVEWMDKIKAGGGFTSLENEISNYTSPYMYIMCALSYFDFNQLYALKLVSVFFDYAASIAVFLILWEMTADKRKSILGMSVLLLLPTVIIDGAYWCQCDIIYTTFILYSLYFFLKDDSKKCFILLGFSFAFKLQALFIAPFFIIMWLKKKTIKLSHFCWLPIIYFLCSIPAWVMGRNIIDLLTIYTKQSNTYPWGTLEYPNIYALLGEAIPDMRHAAEVCGAGTFMTIMILGGLAYYLYCKDVNLTNQLMITIALFSVAIIVYTLPHMHERYGFLIDLLAVIYGVLNVKKLPVLCGFVLVSIISFMPYLIGTHIMPINYVAILQLVLIIIVAYDMYRQIKQNSLTIDWQYN